jgi:hypothetical protein
MKRSPSTISVSPRCRRVGRTSTIAGSSGTRGEQALSASARTTRLVHGARRRTEQEHEHEHGEVEHVREHDETEHDHEHEHEQRLTAEEILFIGRSPAR